MTFRRWFLIALAMLATGVAPPARGADTEADPVARMKKDIFYLSGEECNGRGVGSAGIDKAADYVAARFKEAGLKPGNGGSYFQPFALYGQSRLGTPNTLRLTGPADQAIEARYAAEFMPTGLSGTGSAGGDLVFVGYGISSEEKPKYDDYAGLDVAGKFVVVLRRTPRAEDKKEPFAPEETQLAALSTKLEQAVKHKAAGVIFVNDRTYGKDKDDLMDYRRGMLGGC
jgi:hypothetical protein